MLGTYYLMQAAVEAGVKTVVMAGSNCALGHGFRISDSPFPIELSSLSTRRIPPILKTPTVSQSGLARICWRRSAEPTAFAPT